MRRASRACVLRVRQRKNRAHASHQRRRVFSNTLKSFQHGLMVYSASAQTPEPAPNETNERTNERVRRRNDRAGEREFSDVRANGGRSSCNEIQPHWIHGTVSGVERPSLLAPTVAKGNLLRDPCQHRAQPRYILNSHIYPSPSGGKPRQNPKGRLRHTN